MTTKICLTCKETKTISEFYGLAYPQKNCKECCKKKSREREFIMRQNPEWVEKEKERHRNKYHRLEYKEKHKPSPEKKKETIARYKLNYPEKYKAKNISCDLRPKTKGNELHHWNYNISFAKDVIEINAKDHAKIHRFMKYDKNTFMYKDLNGVLLNTKEIHEEYIRKILLTF